MLLTQVYVQLLMLPEFVHVLQEQSKVLACGCDAFCQLQHEWSGFSSTVWFCQQYAML